MLTLKIMPISSAYRKMENVRVPPTRRETSGGEHVQGEMSYTSVWILADVDVSRMIKSTVKTSVYTVHEKANRFNEATRVNV